ncbi:DUF3137 domain-containing protein [bacterium]|nr:DUF3137 domain-containing protein [bacterium]
MIQDDIIEKIHVKILRYEDVRIKRLYVLLLREIFIFAVLFFLIKSFMLCVMDSDASVFFLAMILGVIYYIFYDITHTNKLFKSFIKSKCSNAIKKFLSINSNSVSKNEITKSNLFGYFEDVNVDDGFCGEYDGVDYAISEVTLTAKSSKGFDIKIFNGLIILFDFNKKILKDTIIVHKHDDSIKQNIHGLNIKRIFIPLTLIITSIVILVFSSSGGIKSIDELGFALGLIVVPLAYVFLILGLPFLILHIIQQRKQNMVKTKMEDIVFNKDYIIHTKDPIEARYLITTAFMERFLKLQKIFKTKNIKCSFFQKNKLMFAIPTRKDLFEVCSLYTSLKNKKYIEKFYSDIEEIKKIIDVLKLNDRTGL